MTREDIYDAEIQPLIDQIVKICTRHGIPIMAAMHIGTEAKPGLMATTIAGDPPENDIPPPIMLLAAMLLAYGPEVLLSIQAVRVKVEEAIRSGQIDEVDMVTPSWGGAKGKKPTLH